MAGDARVFARPLVSIGLVLSLLVPMTTVEAQPGAAASRTLIEGAYIVDGTGSSGYVADLHIEADRIVAIGDLGRIDGETIPSPLLRVTSNLPHH